MARQGCALDEYEIGRILQLLASTEMSIPEIATRIGCSRSAVGSINRKFQIRNYGGNRGRWVVSAESRSRVATSGKPATSMSNSAV
jgi:hypothetical protein